MRRTPLLILGIALGILVGVAVAGAWLPGPRAAIPPSSLASGAISSPPVESSPAPGLPDPRRTPGSINPAATQQNLSDTVCKAGWASSVRPPVAYTSALKIAQIIEYGYADRDPRHYQEDHLVPLELGGAPRDPRNLWPQPLAVTLADGSTLRADQKDALEDALNREVCGGHILLADAQRLIAGNWVSAWRSVVGP